MKFIKPKGATADLREMEYISALHQTAQKLRKDGSIDASDISLFLMSRYGIEVSPDEIAQTVSMGFGGGDISDGDGDVIDLTEMLAMLLVPTLVREAGRVRPDDEEDVEEPSLLPKTPDQNLFRDVLQMILLDVTGSNASPPVLTRELLRDIFLFYGEKQMANHDDLLDSMVAIAGDGEARLNEQVFAKCLTSDVELYDVNWEESLTSTYVDVFETFRSTKKFKRLNFVSSSRALESTSNSEENVEGRTREVLKRYTAPSIDYAVDTFRSKTYVILLWFTWVLFYMSFIGIWGSSNADLGNMRCDELYDLPALSFWCYVGQGVINWLKIMAKLVIFGTIFIVGASVGHSTIPRNPLFVIISMVFIILYTLFPIEVEFEVLPSKDGTSQELSTAEDNDDYHIFLHSALFSAGVMLLILSLINLLDRIIPLSFKRKHPFFHQVISSGTVFMERNMKQAANFKINRMIRHAMEIHHAASQEDDSLGKETAYGKALLCYSKVCDDTEEVGGHRWTWNRLRNGHLFEEEGIWLSNRVMQGNLGQLFLCIALIPIILMLYEYLDSAYSVLNSTLSDYFPDKWRLIMPMSIAFVLAEVNSLALVVAYIPSTIRTTFRFRYGGIGSLHDDEFQKMRRQTEQASLIFGSMFWGCFLSNVLVLGASFIIVSLFCVPQFLPKLLRLISSMIGLGITMMLKQLFLMLVRSKFSGETFYRANPAVANFITVLLESWNLGISVLFAFARMVTLVLAAFIYVARIDIPFLSDSADEVGGMLIDRLPFVFRKDLLQHEAHRHPYLERIGVMYMMKLRYGDSFGTKAGTSWRLLLVYALFPWIRKYRIRGDDDPILELNHKKISHLSRSRLAFNDEKDRDIETLTNEIIALKDEVKHLYACLEDAKERHEA